MMNSTGGKWLQKYFNDEINLSRITESRKEDRDKTIDGIEALKKLRDKIVQIIDFKNQLKGDK